MANTPQPLPKVGPLPADVPLPGGVQPWTNVERFEQARRAGGAGVMLHNVLLKSKSTGIKP